MAVYNPSVVLCSFSNPSVASLGIYIKDREFDSKETLTPLPPLPTDVACRFVNLTGVVNGILCIDFATHAAKEIYSLCNITNSSFLMVSSIQPTSDSGKVLSAFGANSATRHESIVRMWKDDLHGIPSLFSVYDSIHHTWSAIQQLVLDVSQIYDRYIHISGILYWISATETAQTSNYGLMGIITWTSGSLETTRHFTLFVRRNSSNGTAIFRRVKAVKDLPTWMNFLTYRNDKFVFHCDNHFKVDVNKGVCYKDVFIFPGGQLCDMVKIAVPKPHKAKVQKSSDDVPIQYFGFDFVNFRSIGCGVVDSTLLIDVIGLVRNIFNIRRKFSDNFQTNRIPIEIYHACGNVLQVVLCGIHCENFRSFIRNFSGGRIIVAVQWCKVADFHGTKYLITSMEATRLLINEDITCFDNLSVKFQQLERKLDNFRNIDLAHVSSELSKETFADIQLNTISELYISSEYAVHFILATIIKVNTSMDWYYYACDFCTEELDLD
ncbi:replication protein A 70 kDa DNA-binding subunit B-like [Senna tora]|uniref:Replication protein A 70 kDa DNA-binding subunit B-like n=1 Tax=Senna tora TaxID=362788 RepID=A0A834W8E6_9FABA|nr:replication protein A 70 kDa DNA-binding subunit B-like [Senna tora]